MRRHVLTLSPVMWMACACLCLLPRLASAAEPSLAAAQLSLLHACSAPDAAPILHSRAPLPRADATDLDGDDVPSALPQISAYAPTDDPLRVNALQDAEARQSSPSLQPFAPRPPPTPLPL